MEFGEGKMEEPPSQPWRWRDLHHSLGDGGTSTTALEGPGDALRLIHGFPGARLSGVNGLCIKEATPVQLLPPWDPGS